MEFLVVVALIIVVFIVAFLFVFAALGFFGETGQGIALIVFLSCVVAGVLVAFLGFAFLVGKFITGN